MLCFLLLAQIAYQPPPLSIKTRVVLAYGDSKTWVEQYQPYLSIHPLVIETIARSGGAAWDMQEAIDADLAAYTGRQALVVLFNLGVNDTSLVGVTEAEWKADIGYILDAMHVKWPAASIYVMRFWKRGFDANCNTMAGWIDDILVTRGSWAAVGPDERVFLENGDNGVTYTVDGTHPNAAGYALTAQQWQTVLGY